MRHLRGPPVLLLPLLRRLSLPGVPAGGGVTRLVDSPPRQNGREERRPRRCRDRLDRGLRPRYGAVSLRRTHTR